MEEIKQIELEEPWKKRENLKEEELIQKHLLFYTKDYQEAAEGMLKNYQRFNIDLCVMKSFITQQIMKYQTELSEKGEISKFELDSVRAKELVQPLEQLVEQLLHETDKRNSGLWNKQEQFIRFLTVLNESHKKILQALWLKNIDNSFLAYCFDIQWKIVLMRMDNHQTLLDKKFQQAKKEMAEETNQSMFLLKEEYEKKLSDQAF